MRESETIEKRNHNRLKVNELIVEYKIEGGSTIYTAELINLSTGGICMLRSAVLDKGDIIHIKFPFESKKTVLIAKVIRVDGREVGIKFLNTEDQLEKFIEIFNKEYSLLKKGNNKFGEKIYPDNLSPYKENEDEELNNMFDIDKE
ncbi:MAG: PilZ domain-containing protein [archaeon]|nr:PilZ domain-containing protein [archaeon]